jgi:hypothetical protein
MLNNDAVRHVNSIADHLQWAEHDCLFALLDVPDEEESLRVNLYSLALHFGKLRREIKSLALGPQEELAVA